MMVSRANYRRFRVGFILTTIIVVLAYIRKYHVVNFNDRIKTEDLSKSFHQMVGQLKKAIPDNRHKEYVTISNIVQPAVKETDRGPGITWCTGCSPNNLHYLRQLVTVWDGPVSVSVFTHGAQIEHTLTYMSILHLCDTNINRLVSFHLCIPRADAEQFVRDVSFKLADITTESCSHLVDTSFKTVNYGDTGTPFPVNTLRNIALINSQTQYVMNADIDLIPSMDLRRQFLDFINSLTPDTHTEKTAFVLPSFEASVAVHTAITKRELTEKWTSGTIRPFYKTVCYPCQSQTDYERWRSLRENQRLEVAYYRDWTKLWEPFLIVKKDEVPKFDERFKQYGFNRISQMCEIYLSGFKLAVLNNGFLLHDGFKDVATFHPNKRRENFNNMKLYGMLKQELLKKYPDTDRRC